MVGGIGEFRVEGNFGVILGVDGGGFSDVTVGLAMFLDVLLDELLFVYLVDDTLTIAEDGCHCCEGDEEVLVVLDNCT